MTDILIAARFVHFAAMIALFGGSLFAFYGGSDAPAMASIFGRRLDQLLRGAAVLALASTLVWFADTVANLNGDWGDILDPDTLSDALSSPFGVLWAVRSVLIVVLLILSIKGGKTGRGRIVFCGLAGIALASMALTGHASTPKGFGGVLHQIDDAVHLLAAGAWLGGLEALGLVLAIARGQRPEASAAWVRQVVPRFSRMGYWAVGLVVLTGAVNGIILVGHLESLVATAYGQFLLVKIALVVAMVALALVNRFRLSPALAAGGGSGPLDALWRNVMAEQGLGLAVVAVVGILGTLIPAMYH